MSKSKTAAFVAGVVGFAVLSVFAAPVANAQTTADLQAQISALLAQIAQLQAMAGGSSMAGGSAPMAPLTVGSTGAEVSKLQSWLISKGYGIAAGATGTFGPQTRAALAAFQAANGISPAAGYYGSITAAKVASMMGPATPGQTPGTTPVLNGSDGSVTISFNPFAPTSRTLKKGETGDIVAIKLQATSGDVQVSRFDVNFSERPWLDFTKLTLHDQNGNVLGTKMLNSSADATEVNVGSNYLVRFDNLNYVVRPGNDAILVVSATVSSDSDKITGQTVYVGVPSGSIRTINGKGYTDSVGLSSGQGSGVTSSTGNAVTLTQTGSTATIFTRISPSTPLPRIVTTLASSQTPDVVLGVFSLKSQNRGSTINSMSFNFNGTTTVSTSTIFSNVRLCDGSQCYGANSLVAGGTTFTNMSVNLAEDTWKDLTLKADVQSGVSAFTGSSTLVAASIVGVDTNYNTVTLTSASNASSNDFTFLLSGIAITNTTHSFTASAGSSGVVRGGTVTFGFTVTNSGSSDVFISKVPSTALSTSTTGSVGSPASGSSTLTYVVANPGQMAADTGTAPTSGAFVIPAGNSRAFTFTGSLDNTNGTLGLRIFKITQVNFGTSASATTANNITFGLENLVETQTLNP